MNAFKLISGKTHIFYRILMYSKQPFEELTDSAELSIMPNVQNN